MCVCVHVYICASLALTPHGPPRLAEGPCDIHGSNCQVHPTAFLPWASPPTPCHFNYRELSPDGDLSRAVALRAYRHISLSVNYLPHLPLPHPYPSRVHPLRPPSIVLCRRSLEWRFYYDIIARPTSPQRDFRLLLSPPRPLICSQSIVR